MRYVGLTALAIVFWADVILLRMILTHECTPAVVTQAAPLPVAPPVRPQTFVIPHREEDPYFDPYVDHDCGPGPLRKNALVAGLNALRPRIHACYEKFQVPGTAMVNITIATSGRVARAQVTGKFADTATGDCVAAAVKTAHFPQSDGFSTPYPFQLK